MNSIQGEADIFTKSFTSILMAASERPAQYRIQIMHCLDSKVSISLIDRVTGNAISELSSPASLTWKAWSQRLMRKRESSKPATEVFENLFLKILGLPCKEGKIVSFFHEILTSSKRFLPQAIQALSQNIVLCHIVHAYQNISIQKAVKEFLSIHIESCSIFVGNMLCTLASKPPLRDLFLLYKRNSPPHSRLSNYTEAEICSFEGLEGYFLRACAVGLSYDLLEPCLAYLESSLPPIAGKAWHHTRTYQFHIIDETLTVKQHITSDVAIDLGSFTKQVAINWSLAVTFDEKMCPVILCLKTNQVSNLPLEISSELTHQLNFSWQRSPFGEIEANFHSPDLPAVLGGFQLQEPHISVIAEEMLLVDKPSTPLSGIDQMLHLFNVPRVNRQFFHNTPDEFCRALAGSKNQYLFFTSLLYAISPHPYEKVVSFLDAHFLDFSLTHSHEPVEVNRSGERTIITQNGRVFFREREVESMPFGYLTWSVSMEISINGILNVTEFRPALCHRSSMTNDKFVTLSRALHLVGMEALRQVIGNSLPPLEEMIPQLLNQKGDIVCYKDGKEPPRDDPGMLQLSRLLEFLGVEQDLLYQDASTHEDLFQTIAEETSSKDYTTILTAASKHCFKIATMFLEKGANSGTWSHRCAKIEIDRLESQTNISHFGKSYFSDKESGKELIDEWIMTTQVLPTGQLLASSFAIFLPSSDFSLGIGQERVVQDDDWESFFYPLFEKINFHTVTQSLGENYLSYALLKNGKEVEEGKDVSTYDPYKSMPHLKSILHHYGVQKKAFSLLRSPKKEGFYRWLISGDDVPPDLVGTLIATGGFLFVSASKCVEQFLKKEECSHICEEVEIHLNSQKTIVIQKGKTEVGSLSSSHVQTIYWSLEIPLSPNGYPENIRIIFEDGKEISSLFHSGFHHFLPHPHISCSPPQIQKREQQCAWIPTPRKGIELSFANAKMPGDSAVIDPQSIPQDGVGAILPILDTLLIHGILYCSPPRLPEPFSQWILENPENDACLARTIIGSFSPIALFGVSLLFEKLRPIESKDLWNHTEEKSWIACEGDRVKIYRRIHSECFASYVNLFQKPKSHVVASAIWDLDFVFDRKGTPISCEAKIIHQKGLPSLGKIRSGQERLIGQWKQPEGAALEDNFLNWLQGERECPNLQKLRSTLHVSGHDHLLIGVDPLSLILKLFDKHCPCQNQDSFHNWFSHLNPSHPFLSFAFVIGTRVLESTTSFLDHAVVEDGILRWTHQVSSIDVNVLGKDEYIVTQHIESQLKESNGIGKGDIEWSLQIHLRGQHLLKRVSSVEKISMPHLSHELFIKILWNLTSSESLSQKSPEIRLPLVGILSLENEQHHPWRKTMTISPMHLPTLPLHSMDRVSAASLNPALLQPILQCIQEGLKKSVEIEKESETPKLMVHHQLDTSVHFGIDVEVVHRITSVLFSGSGSPIRYVSLKTVQTDVTLHHRQADGKITSISITPFNGTPPPGVIDDCTQAIRNMCSTPQFAPLSDFSNQTDVVTVSQSVREDVTGM